MLIPAFKLRTDFWHHSVMWQVLVCSSAGVARIGFLEGTFSRAGASVPIRDPSEFSGLLRLELKVSDRSSPLLIQ